MKFCSECGNPVTVRIPEGDNMPRHVCNNCDTIHYQNPKIIVGALPVWEDKILLCKRAIEPRHGCWTLPAGFMENKETKEEESNGLLFIKFLLGMVGVIYMIYVLTK